MQLGVFVLEGLHISDHLFRLWLGVGRLMYLLGLVLTHLENGPVPGQLEQSNAGTGLSSTPYTRPDQGMGTSRITRQRCIRTLMRRT